uniref:TF-B3 domain-containing protein n=1 Tax=Solanum lycopersicum TaxID=4081 RepID=A0A3Q7GLC7_SOLLC
KLPTTYTDYVDGILPSNIILRDRFGNMWPIGVTKEAKDIYFEYGWEKFIKDNIVELGDFFIFDFDGTRIFDFTLLGRNGCVKKGVGSLKINVKEEEVEEMNVEHQNSVESKENTRARDSKNISSFDITDENTLVEEKEDEQKEYENREDVPEEEGEKEEPDEYKEDEDDKERTGILKKNDNTFQRRQFATNIFRSGGGTKPKKCFLRDKNTPRKEKSS